MPLQVPPLADVARMVFAAWTLGTASGAAVTRSWRVVQPGHFKVVWLVSAALGAIAALSGEPAMWLVTALSAVTFAAIYRKLDAAAGALTAAVALALVVLTLPPVTLAAAVLLGGVTNAMLLGHWHLNQPRLGTAPIRRVVYGLWAGIVAYAAAAAYLATTGARGPALATLAVLAIIAVLTAMVTQLVRTRSIMSATGVLYLEVLLCFVAVFTGSLSALA